MGRLNLRNIISSRKALILALILFPLVAIGVSRFDDIYVNTLRSSSSNPATSGVVRLSSGDAVDWRNAANSANLPLNLDGSNHLQFNSTLVQMHSSDAFSLTNLNVANLSGSLASSQLPSPIQIADGSSSTPAYSFSNETNTGYYRSGTGDLVLMVDGVQAVEYYKVGSYANVGYGPSGTVGTALTNPVTFYSSFNGEQDYTYGNTSTNAAAYTKFQITAGTPSSSYAINLENHVNAVAGYLANAAMLTANLIGQLNIAVENTVGFIAFNVGGRTLATERARLTTTDLTLNANIDLQQTGSTSGTITFHPQAAAGTYNWNWPITAGAQGALFASGGGGSTASTWISDVAAGSVLTSNGTTSNPTYTSSPTLGVNASVTGVLNLATSVGSGASIAVQNGGATTGYNFNLPITPGTAGYLLTSQGGGSTAMTWTSPSGIGLTSPSKQKFTTTPTSGAVTGYVVNTSGISVAPSNGDTYTNNSNTFTVLGLADSNKILFLSHSGSVTFSGTTLTRTAGSGDSSITFTNAASQTNFQPQAMGTYTTAVGSTWIKVTGVGAGGGSGGSASAAADSAAAAGGGGGAAFIKWIASPGATYFYTLAGTGGAAASSGNNNGGAGGPAAFGSGSTFYVVYGGTGGQGSVACTGTNINSGPANGGFGVAGDILAGGSPGGPGVCLSIGQPLSGAGGNSGMGFGSGAVPCISGAPGTGAAGIGGNSFGGGAGGSCQTVAGGAQAGGQGGGGVLFVEEFAQ